MVEEISAEAMQIFQKYVYENMNAVMSGNWNICPRILCVPSTKKNRIAHGFIILSVFSFVLNFLYALCAISLEALTFISSHSNVCTWSIKFHFSRIFWCKEAFLWYKIFCIWMKTNTTARSVYNLSIDVYRHSQICHYFFFAQFCLS